MFSQLIRTLHSFKKFLFSSVGVNSSEFEWIKMINNVTQMIKSLQKADQKSNRCQNSRKLSS